MISDFEKDSLTPEQYFPELYLQDLENWITHSNLPSHIEYLREPRSHICSIGSICGFPSNHKVFKSQAYKNFISFAHFICVTYEMNVLNFAIYAEGSLFYEWKFNCVPFLETHGYEHSSDIKITSDEFIRYFWFGEPTRLDALFSVEHYPFPSEFVPTPELLKQYDEIFVPSYAGNVLDKSLSLEIRTQLKELNTDKQLAPKLLEIRKRSFEEKLLQSILRDPDCSMFRERNLARLNPVIPFPHEKFFGKISSYEEYLELEAKERMEKMIISKNPNTWD